MFEECEIFQAVFRRDEAVNRCVQPLCTCVAVTRLSRRVSPSVCRLSARPDVLSKIISHIHGSLEVRLQASRNSVDFKSYHQHLDEHTGTIAAHRC